MDLDGDDNFIGLGDFDDAPVLAAHEVHGLLIAESCRALQAVGGGDVFAAGVFRPWDGLEDEGQAVGRAIDAGERKGGIHLRETHAELFHVPAQQQRVLIHGDVGLVSKSVDPTHSVDEAAFDSVHIVVARPFETALEGDEGGVEGIGDDVLEPARLHEAAWAWPAEWLLRGCRAEIRGD